MNINNFIETTKNIPPHIAILVRGPTAIGKSSIVEMLALNHYKLPFIDVRGSTMSEGDVIGYPDLEGMKVNNVMTFNLPSWFMRACKEPVVLFLDEFNRSLPGVMQSFFQIVLDRRLGNDKDGIPYYIHPETRIFAAINCGSEYDVNEIDPALLRRFWVCDLEPTKSDWLAWAKKNNVDPIITSFINKNPQHLRVDPKTVEQGTVVPSNASWARFDECLKFKGIDLITLAGKEVPKKIFNILSGFCGTEASITFVDYISKYKIIVSVEDVLNRYDANKTKIKNLSSDRINTLIDHLGENAKENDWTIDQAKNASKFAKIISEEMLIHMWSVISQSKNLKSIQNFHYYIGKHLVEVVNNSKELFKQ